MHYSTTFTAKHIKTAIVLANFAQGGFSIPGNNKQKIAGFVNYFKPIENLGEVFHSKYWVCMEN